MSEPSSPETAVVRKRPSRRWLLAIVAVLIVVATAGYLLLAGDESDAAGDRGGVTALTVTAASPRSVQWPVALSASGSVAAWQEASIGTQIGSYQLVDVRVNVGDRVARGQILASLDPALLRAEEAQLLATYEQAEANRKRAIGMQGSGAISDQEVLRFVTEARSAAAALAAKRTQLRYTNVLAPDSGTISARSATLGQVVPAGQELFRLIRQNRLEWRGELTAEQIGRVRVGQIVSLTLPDGRGASASVRQIAPSLDADSRLALVYADIRPGGGARAGMFAAGEIELGDNMALVVPAESVIIRDGRSHVLVLAGNEAETKVALRAVEVGRRRGSDAEITKGLRASERVVVRGAGFLKDRDLVRVAGPAHQAGAPRR